jgi:hypothetical protein
VSANRGHLTHNIYQMWDDSHGQSCHSFTENLI